MSIVLGDFGRVNPAVIHGWNVDTLDFIHVTVDTSGALIVTGGGGGGSTVDQGSGGLSAWLVTGPLTDTQLRASDVKVTLDSEVVPVTGSFYQATQPVSLASAPSTPITNANLDIALSTLATATKQDTGNTSLASLDAKAPALGQALAASSVPVILPSATITTLTPPAAITGFATSAKQDTGNASLASIDTKLTNPLPVSLASAPSTPVTNANLDVALSTLATEATLALGATAANQATEIASLASLVAKDFATQTTLALLTPSQGDASADVAGPLVQAVVSDAPQSFSSDTIQPLSLTSEGRLRVSTVPADIGSVWQFLDDSPWAHTNPWEMESR